MLAGRCFHKLGDSHLDILNELVTQKETPVDFQLITKDRRALLTVVSFALAMIAGMFLMVVPLYTSARQDTSGWHMTH